MDDNSKEGASILSGTAGQTPSNELITGAAIATAIFGAGGKFFGDQASKGVDAIIKYAHDEGPITHRVIASWFEDGGYCLAIEFVSLTGHGSYIENIRPAAPHENFNLLVSGVAKSSRGRMDFGSSMKAEVSFWKMPQEVLPLYLAAGARLNLYLQLSDDLQGTLGKKSNAVLEFSYTIAGSGDQPKTKDMPARLRKGGPFYRV